MKMQDRDYDMRIVLAFMLISLIIVRLAHADELQVNEMDNHKLLDLVTATIQNNDVDEKEKNFVYKSLNAIAKQYPAEVNYLLGQIFYFGIFENRNLEKAINYLTISSELNDTRAQYLLGTILAMEQGYVHYEQAIPLLEKAAADGIPDAMHNLYILYRKEKYPKDLAIEWLKKAANIKFEPAMFFLKREEYLAALESNDKEKLEEIAKYLISERFESLSGERYFLLAKIYNSSSPLSDDDLRLKYLQLSADEGFDLAINILSNYNRLVEQQVKEGGN
ncbi:tetratricopeptide repeat protein [Shewanella amazonensis]|nr:tetratricopeptide repeat protein [Shewanella amazonensis]